MTAAKDTLLDRFGRFLAERLEGRSSGYDPYTPSDPETLRRTLQPGDVLLIEGNQRISNAIKYLTQSTWSHAALYVGDALPDPADGSERPRLVEVNLGQGCVAAPLSKYRTFNTRICRASGLTPDDREAVVRFMIGKLGLRYDLKNIFDMLRYLLPTPPVPVRWRRRMIAFGSGDPTRAICSTLIAQAYAQIRYPILPDLTRTPGRASAQSRYSRQEILHIRHHSLFTPRDFDLSPFFRVVKPTLEFGFDYRDIQWADDAPRRTAAPSVEIAAVAPAPAQAPAPAPAPDPAPDEAEAAAPAPARTANDTPVARPMAAPVAVPVEAAAARPMTALPRPPLLARLFAPR